jgi:hypothetical protein
MVNNTAHGQSLTYYLNYYDSTAGAFQSDTLTWDGTVGEWLGNSARLDYFNSGGYPTWVIRPINNIGSIGYSSPQSSIVPPDSVSYTSNVSTISSISITDPATSNSFGQPLALDLLIQGIKVADLTWNNTHVRWQNSGASWILQAGSSSEGYTILDSGGSVTGSPKPAKSGTTVQHPSSPIAGQNGELRTDGKVGYIPTQTGDSDTYEIVADGGSTAGNSSGNPLSGSGGGSGGGGQAAGDPHISPLFGEKYDL